MGKYLAIARVALMERAAYGADVLARAGMMVIFLFVFANLWGKVMVGGARFSGLDHRAIVWYIVVTEVLMTAIPSVGSKINHEVRTGSFVSYLVRPCNYVLFHLCSFLGEASLGIAINGAAGALVATLIVGLIRVRSAHLPIVLLALFLGLVLNFCLMATIALISFWVEDNEPFFWIYNKFQLILGGVLIPLDFFPSYLREIAEKLPFGYMFYGPARLAVNFSSIAAQKIILGQLIWLVLAGLGLYWVFSACVKQVNVNGG